MKKNYYFTIAALAIMAVACTREDALVGSGDSNSESALGSSDVTYINAIRGEAGDTKASIDDDAKFAWTAGDKVAVYAGTYKISDVLTEGGSNAATFAFSGSESFGQGVRANFAVYPASLVFDAEGNKYADDVTASSLKINLPATYNLSEVKDANAPTPMVAVNAPEGTLEFKSICALLKFTLHSVPMQTKYITFDFNDKKVAGEFVICNVNPGDDETKAVASDTEEFDDVITVYNDNVFSTFQNDLVVNIPVPAGEYVKVTITSWDGDPWNKGHKINGITSTIRTAAGADGQPQVWTAGRLSSGKREVYLPVFSFGSKDVAVGEGKKVVFAPGNLRADLVDVPTSDNVIGSATNWRFAEKQYDAIFNSGSEGLWLREAGQTIDLFSWIGSDANYHYDECNENQKYGVLYSNLSDAALYVGNTSPSDWLYIKSDWGGLEIQGGNDFAGQPADAYTKNTWRLPGINNKQELEYLCERNAYNGVSLLSSEANAKSKEYCIAKAQICNDDNTMIVWGVIIFPDHYNIPSLPVGVPEIKNTVYYASAENGVSSDNKLSIAQWEALEAVGCVFLPAASYRGTASDKCNNSGDGVYWTNQTKNYADKAVAMVFCDTSINATTYNGIKIRYSKTFLRKQGASVRIVREIN